MRILFIDAYNVINTWPTLKPVKEGDFGIAREKLIEVLQNYGTFTGYKIYVVFDGYMVQGNIGDIEKTGSLVIVYTKEGETADKFIERTIDKIGKKVDVCVVTSDSLEQQLAFQRGATRMSSLEFYHEVLDINRKIQKTTESKFLQQRNPLEERVEKNILEKLEKIRRSH